MLLCWASAPTAGAHPFPKVVTRDRTESIQFQRHEGLTRVVQLHEEHETSRLDCTAGDEGVGNREQLVGVPVSSAVCDHFPQKMGRRMGHWPRPQL
jgi:hypothetical protein